MYADMFVCCFVYMSKSMFMDMYLCNEVYIHVHTHSLWKHAQKCCRCTMYVCTCMHILRLAQQMNHAPTGFSSKLVPKAFKTRWKFQISLQAAVCIYVCMCVCMFECMSKPLSMSIYACIHVYIHMRIALESYTRKSAWMHACMPSCMHAYTIHKHIHCIYTHIQRTEVRSFGVLLGELLERIETTNLEEEKGVIAKLKNIHERYRARMFRVCLYVYMLTDMNLA
jgi:hypothetical protein